MARLAKDAHRGWLTSAAGAISSLLSLSGCVSGCVAQSSADHGEIADPRPADRAAAAEPRCTSPGAQTLAFASVAAPEPAPCPMAVVLDAPTPDTDADAGTADEADRGAGLSVVQHRPIPDAEATTEPEPELLGRGQAPSACGVDVQRCELELHATSLGPLVRAALRGHESEVPEQVFWGWLIDAQLVFAPSWHSPSAVADHTRIGPAFALAPFDCAGALTLLPTPRLPAAEAETLPDALTERAGEWTLDELGQVRPPSEPAALSEGCTPLFEGLP
ncbi:hypothetical protein G6O69_19295 [Pseudenhygromyxa sp. WMMC2535]|uniref:hypothetical protein n=1 Tax=Pseudenhygromyxa sp. WMMC2535 TaxID=2712867 RepID=UPI0015960390|nr:hypothetical protein [Pseudenhygromyxa sp. WMMC2535]NVB39999.1 hypothetical protein [Pseudenhygromyxa sp. WMMC2535]